MVTSTCGARLVLHRVGILLAVVALASVGLVSCGGGKQVSATNSETAGNSVSVAVAPAARKTLDQHLTVSSELVPYQEIDVFAKESGYVKKLNVDYGSHVKAGDILAVLEIPELEAQLQQDDAAIKAADEQVQRLGKLSASMEARRVPLQQLYERIATVAKEHPGLVIPQEVDDAQGRALTAQSDVDAANANIEAAKSNAEQARAKRLRDSVLYDYRNVKAEFDGVVTQRYANLGTLLQAGTSSSTQAMPLVRLSEDDRFRLVIPVAESYVRYIRVGDPVSVEVPSLESQDLPRKRSSAFSEDVAAGDTYDAHRSRGAESRPYAEAGTVRQRHHPASAEERRIVDTATGFGPASRPRLGGRARSIQSDRSPKSNHRHRNGQRYRNSLRRETGRTGRGW